MAINTVQDQPNNHQSPQRSGVWWWWKGESIGFNTTLFHFSHTLCMHLNKCFVSLWRLHNSAFCPPPHTFFVVWLSFCPLFNENTFFVVWLSFCPLFNENKQVGDVYPQEKTLTIQNGFLLVAQSVFLYLPQHSC